MTQRIIHPRRSAQHMRRVDEFAELLSQDLSRAEIMVAMGLNANGYKMHLRTLKRELGDQAR